MELQRVESNGLSFNVAVEGEGPAVLLLHGFPDSHRLWRHQMGALAAAGYRAIAPDLRGFGDSDRPSEVERYAMPLLLADVLGIMDSLDVPAASVVAHDWGAALGWGLAAFVPDRVDRLAALTVGHPAAYGDAGMRQRELSWYMLWFQFVGVAEEQLPRDDWALMRAWIGSVGPDVDDRIAALARPGALVAALNWYRANITAESYVGLRATPVPPVSCPVLGVWADGDKFLTEEWMLASEGFVKGPWTYARVGSDHWIPTSAPDELNRLLLDFLGAT